MNRAVVVSVLIIASLCSSLGFAQTAAEASIGTVKSFDGTVRVLSGNTIVDVKKVGQEIMSNDRIQTEQGNVEVQFKDGANLKVDPFSVVGVTERTETKGIIFKSKEDARRLTANTGTAFFSSGKGSTKKNYLQTPTAVCGLRGSAGSWGNGNINQTEGTHKKQGDIKDGQPKKNTADGVKNDPVFNAIKKAAQSQNHNDIQRARQSIAQSMLKNPDPVVTAQSKAENAVASAAIAAFDAKDTLDKAKDAAKKASDEAKKEGATEEAKKAAADAEKAVQQAEKQLAAINSDLTKAVDALQAGNFAGALNTAQQVENDTQTMTQQLQLGGGTGGGTGGTGGGTGGSPIPVAKPYEGQ